MTIAASRSAATSRCASRRERRRGHRLERAIAICPVLRPHSTMDVLEQGPFIYHQYFISKWKQSLR
jgi:hypothetical protein